MNVVCLYENALNTCIVDSRVKKSTSGIHWNKNKQNLTAGRLSNNDESTNECVSLRQSIPNRSLTGL